MDRSSDAARAVLRSIGRRTATKLSAIKPQLGRSLSPKLPFQTIMSLLTCSTMSITIPTIIITATIIAIQGLWFLIVQNGSAQGF